MAEVPEAQGPGLRRPPGQAGQVGQGGGPVVRMAGDHQGDLAVQRTGQPRRRNRPDPDVGPQGRKALKHVAVGGEIALDRQDDPAAGPQGQGPGGQLEEVDRDGVGDSHLVGVRPDEGSDPRRGAARQADPVGGVPSRHPLAGPFRPEGVSDRGDRRPGRRPQGVPVQVDFAARLAESPDKGAKGIGAVQAPARGEAGRRIARAGHRHFTRMKTGLA